MKPPKRRAFEPQRYVSDTTFEIHATESTVLRFVITPAGLRVEVDRSNLAPLSTLLRARAVVEFADLLRVFHSVTRTRMTCSISLTQSDAMLVGGRRPKPTADQDGIAATYSVDGGVRLWVQSGGKRSSGCIRRVDLLHLDPWFREAALDMR